MSPDGVVTVESSIAPRNKVLGSLYPKIGLVSRNSARRGTKLARKNSPRRGKASEGSDGVVTYVEQLESML